MLCSPSFLYFVEREAGPGDPGGIRQLDDHELAVRMAYSLWNTMPDAGLRDLADRGRLRQELDREIDRMIDDPRFLSFCERFTAQWLHIGKLEEFTTTQVAGLTPDLARSMFREAVLYVAAVLREDRSLLDLVDGATTFADLRLVKHYGITLPAETLTKLEANDGFIRVDLPANRRGGILTLAATLIATSQPSRTSPVARGAWILETILGAPPPPPPPNVPDLVAAKTDGTPLNLRKQLEEHRRNPTCASCHDRIDPLGFVLESYDHLGKIRARYGDGSAIDSSAVLPNGASIVGADGLRRMVRESRSREFLHCFAEKMLVYALGRGLNEGDEGTMADLLKTTAAAGDRGRALIKAIVHSPPMASRQFQT